MDYDLIQQLRSIRKDFYTIADLEKIYKFKRPSLYVILNRLVKKGILQRPTKGIYQVSDVYTNPRKIASQLYSPCYLSFVTALADYGILNQIPYTSTFATTKKSKRIILMDKFEIEYSKLKKSLFFGYELKKDGVYWALPEKALLDQLYMVSLGKASLDFEELNLHELSKTKFLQWAKKYPPRTQKLAKKLVKDFGKISITVK